MIATRCLRRLLALAMPGRLATRHRRWRVQGPYPQHWGYRPDRTGAIDFRRCAGPRSGLALEPSCQRREEDGDRMTFAEYFVILQRQWRVWAAGLILGLLCGFAAS